MVRYVLGDRTGRETDASDKSTHLVGKTAHVRDLGNG